MKRYSNNEKVNYGVYVSTRPLDICMVGEDGERIDGRPHASYLRLPTWLLLALAPALGGIFVFAFPALVAIALGYGLVRMVAKPAQEAVEDHAYVAQMRWSPVASHLQHEEGQEGQPAAQDDELSDAVKQQRDAESAPETEA